MRLVRDLEAWRRERALMEGLTIGLVPTMGALHQGHLELVARSARECERTVVSVFVNAPQFNDPGDLARYPRELDSDARLAATAGADVILAPPHEAMYADGFRYRVTETDLASTLEGSHRPGHFDGVLTVVLKLLNLVRPHRAYFGEKDYQQYELVAGMAAALFVPVEIVPCPTVRDPDGLALSSRNRLLSPEARRRAPLFPELLAAPAPAAEVRRRLEEAGFRVDYVADVGGRRFAAVHLEGVRLIDNLPLPEDRS